MNTERKPDPFENELDNLSINTIRFLSIDAVQKANSGHPGLPMGSAAMAYVLWKKYLKHNPTNPKWFDRDRFVLSAGHGSMLLYSLLYLTGYNLSLDEIKSFRQWGSKTPGHPERDLTPGVEVTTGPLGQGFANAVGLAIAETFLAAYYNRPGYKVIDHYTYVLASDGDLMEGVASEAASLAGHLKLNKLVCLYADNHISLSASTNLTFTEDRASRFEAYGWRTITVDDSNDLAAIEQALQNAREDTRRPTIIMVRTHLGYGSPNKQDSFLAHGSPLGEEEVKKTKQNLNWPVEPTFYVPQSVLTHFRSASDRGKKLESEWQQLYSDYAEIYPDLAEELNQLMENSFPEFPEEINSLVQEEKPVATRVISGKVLNAVAPFFPTLIGGSADLDPSTHTALEGMGDYENLGREDGDLQGSVGGGWGYAGRNIHFGVREHAMGAILNGLAAHDGIIPYGSTFLIFSDYMRPSIRLAALMGLHVIYVFTHDSIGLGEDGPTHQPVEQLLGLRSIPNHVVIRPADPHETVAAWRVAINHRHGPVSLVLSRQKLPPLNINDIEKTTVGVEAGAYVLSHGEENTKPEIILVATGSEVHLALSAQEKLGKKGIPSYVISMPSWNLFQNQPDEYRNLILPPDIPVLAIEAGVSLGWKTYLQSDLHVMSVDRFGASAPGEIVMDKYGFNVDHILQKVESILELDHE